MKAYANAILQSKHLKELYESACYAFAQTEAVIAWKADRKFRNVKAKIGLNIPKPILYRPRRALQLRAQLREIIFIRLVSVLETYLVDSVREVFTISKRPFKDQVPLQITQAEVLSAASLASLFSKIVNRECRNLSSGGYGEIVKYYKRRFGLDLGALAPGRHAMEEYHERRHVFVHRMGKPDAHYRKTYHISGSQLHVTNDYLLGCFNAFEEYMRAVNHYFQEWLPSIRAPDGGVSKASRTYKITFPSTKSNNPEIVQERFTFWAGDDLYSLADIATQRNSLSDRECEITVSGETFVLSAYDKLLRNAEKELGIEVSRSRTYGVMRIKKIVPSEILDSIRAALPPQPWPKGVHKEVAQKLGYKNRVVTEAIQVLISKGVFKQQYDGQIVN